MHGVVDGQPGGHAAAGAVDVEVDVGFGVLVGQDEHLGDDQVGHGVIDGGAQDDDAILEQAGIDIHRPLFTTAPFDHDRDQWHGRCALLGKGALGRGRDSCIGMLAAVKLLEYGTWTLWAARLLDWRRPRVC